MMKSFFKNWDMKSLVIMLVSLILLVCVPYFYKFHGELSSNSSDWASFATYFGGMVGSLGTLITIVYVAFTFLYQNEEANKDKKMLQLEEQIFKVRDEIRDITKIEYTPFEYHHLIDVILKFKNNGETFEITSDKDVYIISVNGVKMLEYNRDLFTLINLVKIELGAKTAYDVFFVKDTFYTKQHLLTFASQIKMYMNLIVEIKKYEYSDSSIKYMLSLFSEHLELLSKLNKEYLKLYVEYNRLRLEN